MLTYLCNKLLKLKGWHIHSEISNGLKKFVLVGAPHTSNWDFLLAMGLFHEIGLKKKFTIKKQWLRPPLKHFFLWLGAIPIDRERIQKQGGTNSTDIVAKSIKEAKELVFLITPEGTRKRTSQWKTGFYHIAVKANVPIVLAYGDYKKKSLGLGKIIFPTNMEEDLKSIMQFYASVTPHIPQNFLLDKRYI